MPSRQNQVLLESAADQWLLRNKSQLGQRDPITDMIHEVGLKPTSVLEIGCSNGWRLKKLKEEFRCSVTGIEPSLDGVMEAMESGVDVIRGTANELPFEDSEFDLVIFGFCLYFCEPQDLFKIVAEADRVLKDNSYLMIWDFLSPKPFKRVYSHDKEVWSYHFEPSKLWLAHPGYHKAHEKFYPHNFECVSLLYKHMETAFPAEIPEVET